jgi:hypothetical protein
VIRRPPVLAIGLAVAGAHLLALAAIARALTVQVTTVRATAAGPSDAQLAPLRPRLRRLVGYRSFRVVREEHRPCVWRSREAFLLPDGRLLHVVPKAMRDETVVMRVELLDGRRSLVDTDVRLQNRGVMLFGVNPETGPADGAMIVIIKAVE